MATLVTGATGTIGSEVVKALLKQGRSVRAMSRDPSRIDQAGVETIAADFDDPSSLTHAVSGVKAVFLATGGSASSSGGHPGEAISRHDLALIAAAKRARVEKIVKLSSYGTGITTSPPLGNWHGPGEDELQASGLAWTLLRPVAFASNAKRWAGALQASGVVHSITGSGKQGVVDPRDVAAVAAQALMSAEHDGKIYTLTGPELLSEDDQATILAHLLGRQIDVVADSLEETRRFLADRGMASDAVDASMAGIAYVRAGACEFLTEDVERVTGRKPGSFDHWARDNLAAFGTR